MSSFSMNSVNCHDVAHKRANYQRVSVSSLGSTVDSESISDAKIHGARIQSWDTIISELGLSSWDSSEWTIADKVSESESVESTTSEISASDIISESATDAPKVSKANLETKRGHMYRVVVKKLHNNSSRKLVKESMKEFELSHIDFNYNPRKASQGASCTLYFPTEAEAVEFIGTIQLIPFGCGTHQRVCKEENILMKFPGQQ